MDFDLNKLLQQAQEISSKMAEDNQKFESQEFKIDCNGAINITIKGDYTIKELKIDDDLIEDKEFLVETLVLAFNKAIEKVNSEKKKIEPNLSSFGL